MGQKTNPISLRLQNVNRNFDSSWYSDYFYAKCFSREYFLKNYISNFLKSMKLPEARIFVNFGIQNIKLYPFFCIPKASRISLAKNLGLFQNLSKAWTTQYKGLEKNNNSNFKGLNNSNLIALRNKDKLEGLVNKEKQQPTTNLNDNLFFNSYYSSSNSVQKLSTQVAFLFNKQNKSNHLLKNNKNLSFLENISARILLNEFSTYYNQFHSEKSSNLEPNEIVKTKALNKNNLKELLSRYYNISELTGSRNNSYYNAFHFHNHYEIEKSKVNYSDSKQELNELKNSIFSFSIHNNPVKNNETLKTLSQMPTQEQLINSFYKNTINNTLEGLDGFHNDYRNKVSEIVSMLYNKNFKYKTHMENFLSSQYNIDLQLIPFLSKHNWQSAGFIADEIVYFLEKRITFSRIKNRILKQASMNPHIRGLRITCSGRVGGKSKKAQRATQESVKYGETSLHVFDCKIDFASKSANTSFGTVGVKVWICFH